MKLDMSPRCHLRGLTLKFGTGPLEGTSLGAKLAEITVKKWQRLAFFDEEPWQEVPFTSTRRVD